MRPLLHLARSSGYTAGMSTVKDWGSYVRLWRNGDCVGAYMGAAAHRPHSAGVCGELLPHQSGGQNGVKEAVRDLDMERAAHREQ